MLASLLEDNQACLLTEDFLGCVTKILKFLQHSLEVELKFVTPGLMKGCDVATAQLLPSQLMPPVLGRRRQGPFLFCEN